MYVRSISVFLGRCLATSLVMRSKPGTFLLGNVSMQCWTSAGENALGSRVICKGESKNCSISLEKAGLFILL